MEISPQNEVGLLDAFSSWDTFKNYAKGKIRHPGFRKHSKNMGWMFAVKIASMVISFIATIFIARRLGPTNYGQLNYALSFVGLFGFIATLGIDQILYRDLIKYPEKRDKFLGSALAVRMIASVITVILCMLFAFIFSARDVSLLLIFIVSLTFVFSTFQLISYEFQAEANQKYPSLISLIVVLILNVLKIIVIMYGKGVIYLALVVLLEPILYAIGFIYFRIKVYGTIKYWSFDKAIAVSILKDSFPLIFAGAFFAIYSRIDQVMLKNMMGAASVGLYSSAVSVSEVWYFIPNIIISAIFPAIINAKKTSEKLYYERIKKLFWVLILISAVTALPTAIFSKPIITIIFGAGFSGAFGVLQIYVWSNIGGALNAFAQQLLITENYTKIILLTSFLGMATNVLLNIFLIPRYGISGAAFASLISYIIPFCSLILFKQTRNMILGVFKIKNK